MQFTLSAENAALERQTTARLYYYYYYYLSTTTTTNITSLFKVIWEEGHVAALAVAHIHRKVPIGYNGAPQIRPQNASSRGPISEPHYLPHPWTVRPMMPNGIRIRPTIFPQCTGQTDGRTHVRTYVLTYIRTYGRTDRQIVHGKV